MAMIMPQTPKTQANVASAQKTANNKTAQKPVTFNTASNSTNNAQEKTTPAVQPQTTETVNNEAAVKPQQPVASQSVAQGSAKTISTPSANEQNTSVEKPVVEKQTVAQPQTKVNVQQNNFATTSQTAQTTPKETFHQTVTFHDDVTGASKTVTTQINGNKSDEYDVYNTDLSLPNGYYLDCSNIAKGNPNTITQDNEKFNYNIVNPYNVVKEDFNTDIGGLNGKDFPVENQLYDNSITHPIIPMIAPGLGCWDLMKIMFVDQNGKQVGTQTVDPNNYKDIENDWADYAFKVTAPNGYKFVDPRENFVAFTAPLGRGTNTAKMQNGYMVYPVEATDATNNTSSQSNNDLPINKGGYKLQLTGPKGNQTATLSYNGSTLRTYKNINSVTSNSNQVILLSDNEEMLTYITQPNNTDSISIKFTETKKGAISAAKSSNAQIVYVGNNKPNVKDTDPVDDFSCVKKDGTGYVLITDYPGSNQMTYTKGILGTDLGTAPDSIAQITSMSTSNSGADIIVKLQGGKQVDLRNNWLTQNTSSNTNKPASNTGNNGSSQSKPANSNINGSTNNKPSGSTQPNSTAKPVGTTGNTANDSTNKPTDSSTSDTNKPSASSNANSNKPTNGSTSVNSNKPATGSSVSGNKPATNSNTSADKPASSSSTANTNKPSTGSNGSSSSQAGSDSTSTSANKPANTSSSSTEQPIKVTVHYVDQDGKIVGTVIDTVQPGSTLDVSKNVPQGYEVSSAFKPQTGIQADNDQATLNVPVVPVGQNGKASQANDKSSANNTPNNGKKNADQANNAQKSNDKQKATNGIQAQEKGNMQSLNVNSDRNASEGAEDRNANANSNAVPTFNVAGNASQAASIAQATGNGQGGVQASASASVVQSNQASSASPSNSGSSANALPETGMSNEGVAFAAAMLALAGLTMIKHEHEE